MMKLRSKVIDKMQEARVPKSLPIQGRMGEELPIQELPTLNVCKYVLAHDQIVWVELLYILGLFVISVRETLTHRLNILYG